MPHPKYTSDEIATRGQAIYENYLRAEVETDQNLGKIIALDVETGEYEVADDVLTASDLLLDRQVGAAIFGVRIGYNAVYALGGTLTRLPELVPTDGGDEDDMP